MGGWVGWGELRQQGMASQISGQAWGPAGPGASCGAHYCMAAPPRFLQGANVGRGLAACTQEARGRPASGS